MKTRILFVGENIKIGSGFAAQGRGICRAIANATDEEGNLLHELSLAMWCYNGLDPITDLGFPFEKAYPLSSKTSYWGTEYLPYIVNMVDPHMIIAYGDPQFLNERGLNIINLAKQTGIPLAAYIAIDSPNHPEWVGKDLAKIPYPVVFTHWAKGTLSKEFPHLEKKLRVIYHGMKDYRLLSYNEKKLQRQSMAWQSKGQVVKIAPETKVILSVFRNCKRKCTDRLLEAVSILRKKRQDFVLILHTQQRDRSADSLDLSHMVKVEYKAEDYVFFSNVPNPTYVGGNAPQQMSSDALLNIIYGTADLFVLASGREGWGLPLNEAALAGVASVGTDFASISEILAEDRGWLVPINKPYPDSTAGTYPEAITNYRTGLVDVDKLAEAIDYALDNPKERNEKMHNLRKWTIENCSWDSIGQQWVDLVGEVEEDLRERKLFFTSAPTERTDVTWYTDLRKPQVSFSIVGNSTVRELQKQGVTVEKADNHTLLGNQADEFFRDNVGVVHPLMFFIMDNRLEWDNVISNLKSRHNKIIGYEVADTDRISDRFVGWMNDERIDGIFTPTSYSKQVMHDSGVKKRVYVVGHGVDIYEPTRKYQWLQTKFPKPKVLMFCLHSPQRKGLDLMEQLASKFKDRVTFVIKAGCPEALKFQGVIPITEWLDPNDMASLYKYTDIFLSLHRGGGFELNPLEAMCYGHPTILTGHGSVLDYANEDNAYLVKPAGFEKVYKGGYSDHCGDGARADLEHAASLLDGVLNDLEAARQHALANSPLLIQKWTWARSADLVKKALIDLGAVPEAAGSHTSSGVQFAEIAVEDEAK